jgi:hypothetical protein
MPAVTATNFTHNTNLVRLRHAVLCASCELISEANNGHCAACDSEALLSLSRILGGSVESEAQLGLTACANVSEETVRIRFASSAA